MRLVNAGVDVTVSARPKQLEAIRKSGITLKTEAGEENARPQLLGDKTILSDKTKQPDLVLVCTKMFDLEGALDAIASSPIGGSVEAVGFQNGVDAVQTINAKLGKNRAVAGTAHISASLEKAGVVSLHGKLARFFIAPSPITKQLANALPQHIKIAENITQMLWDKFIFLTAFSGATALFRKPIGDISEAPALWSFYKRLMEESWQVAKAEAPTQELEASLEKWLEASKKMPHQYKASMALDLERGKPLELKWLSGKVVALGNKHRIATPCSGLVCSVLEQVGR